MGKTAGQLGAFERLRRTLDHQQAMSIIVYDDAHRASAFAGRHTLAALGRGERERLVRAFAR